MATQQAAAQVIQALKAGYADSYSAVGHVVDTASVQLTGQPSATSRQLSALNVAANANAAATGTRAVTVGALAIMPPLATGTIGTNAGYGGGAAGGGTSGGGFLSLPVAGVVGGVLAGGVTLAAALPTAASVLGRALLSGSASVGGVVPFRSIALPGPGVQSGVTMYQISPAGGSAAGNRPIGVAYGTTAAGFAANQSQGGGAGGAGVPPGTLLPDGTVAGTGQGGLGGPGAPTQPTTGAVPDLTGGPKTGLGAGGVGGIGGGGLGGGIGGGGLGGLGSGLARTVAFSDLSSLAGGAAAAVAAPAGAVGSMAGAAGMNGMMPMMPMGAGAGAGAGGEGGNRRVPTWLVETEDVWGETAAVAPGVIGETR